MNEDNEGELKEPTGVTVVSDPIPGERRKFYFDGGQVEIAAELVHELDADGKLLRVVKFRGADQLRDAVDQLQSLLYAG